MLALELVLKNVWEKKKNPAAGYSKTMVSRWRGCIFQGFQRLQKVGKTTPEVVRKCPQNSLQSGSEGSPKRSLKLQWKIQKTLWKKVSKMRSGKRVFSMFFWYFFAVWVQRCPRVAPGTLPGSFQGQNASKMGLQTIGKSSKMWSAGFLKTVLKGTRTKHVSK